ncbi:Helicase associated domain protein [Streptomyces lavendulae]|uniref:helicase associated domain-containing protein n=1 Tax=Streptomyces lavendulae TaxID=1914 RepID=UPI00367B98BC
MQRLVELAEYTSAAYNDLCARLGVVQSMGRVGSCFDSAVAEAFNSTVKVESGGILPTEPGEVMHQGEDLGRWVRSVRLGWDNLTTAQQWLCEHVLGIEPAGEDEMPTPRRTQAAKWAMNFEAARQFFEREGHLRVPRKHVERIVGEDQAEREVRLGAWISNQRSRTATLPPERAEQLSAIGMRWA